MNQVTRRLRPGVWTIPVPMEDSPIGWTLVYVIESNRGPVLIDAGSQGDVSWAALVAGIEETGSRVGDCYGVLVTHYHDDHLGLAGRVREESGAWIALHSADADVLQRQRGRQDEWQIEAAELLLESGAPESALIGLPDLESVPILEPALPDRTVEDDRKMAVPGWDIRAIWTPGHSPGHCCFVLEEYDVLLSGDHVLPTISPHVGIYTEEGRDDPLGDYVDSLQKLEPLDHAIALPAHEGTVGQLGERRHQLLQHHRYRLASIAAILQRGPESEWTIAKEMPWNRAWDELTALMKSLAVREARAHLRHMERHGQARLLTGTTPRTWHIA